MILEMPLSQEVQDRAIGCLVGLAVGDALGTTLEGRIRGSFSYHDQMIGGGPYHLDPGQWTDDTSMALMLGHSLLAKKGLNGRDLMTRFASWLKDGAYSCTGNCFDVGYTTRGSIEEFLATGNALCGPVAFNSAGNGSIMRLAPAAIFGVHSEVFGAQIARDQSRTTHGSELCIAACDLLARVLFSSIHGRGLGIGKGSLENPAYPDQIRSIARGDWRGKVDAQISSSDFVVHTLEAALWAVDRSSSFREAVICAVNLGDDADTVGAVAGQLAGAKFGYSDIPEEWLNLLAWHDEIRQLAQYLYAAAPLSMPSNGILAKIRRLWE